MDVSDNTHSHCLILPPVHLKRCKTILYHCLAIVFMASSSHAIKMGTAIFKTAIETHCIKNCDNNSKIYYLNFKIQNYCQMKLEMTKFNCIKCKMTKFYCIKCKMTKFYRIKCKMTKFYRIKCKMTKFYCIKCKMTKFYRIKCKMTKFYRIKCNF